MYQPVALFIGLRYMRGRASDRFGRFVSWLSTIGITLGGDGSYHGIVCDEWF